METRDHGRSARAGRRRATRREIALVLVTVVVAGLALFGFAPRAAGTLVTVVDSFAAREARVDRTGSLTVSTRPVNATAWRAVRRGAGALFAPPGTVGGRVTLVVGSLTITNGTTDPVVLSLDVLAPCSPAAGFVDPVSQVLVQANSTLHLDFPQPLEVSAARFDWCLNVAGDPALPRAVTTSGVGYFRS